MLLSVPPTSHTAPPRPSASKEPAGNTASSNALVKQGQSAPGIVVVVALVVVVVVVVVDVVVVEAVVVDVGVGDPPLRSSTHASAVASMALHGWVCAVQSPLLCAFVHEEDRAGSSSRRGRPGTRSRRRRPQRGGHTSGV